MPTTRGARVLTRGRTSPVVQVIPPAVRRSTLMREGGFAVVEGLADGRTTGMLRAEAVERSGAGQDCIVLVSDGEEVRGGRPARRFRNAPGGPLLGAFYNASWVLDFLREMTCPSVRPTGETGTYSYYVHPGDFLALHRDIVTCDIALITCLSNGTACGGDGGKVCLYPGRFSEPLSAIRTTPNAGVMKLLLEPGQTLVMYGGIVPHALLPVAEGQARIVSVLCYQTP
jgi:hypothetical protein